MPNTQEKFSETSEKYMKCACAFQLFRFLLRDIKKYDEEETGHV